MNKLAKLLYLLLCVMLLSLLVRDVINYDIWWHLKSGEFIVENKSVPRTDPFSYPLQDREWVDIHWLFQLLLLGLSKLGGFPALIILKTAIYLATFAILLGTGRKWGYSLAAAAALLLSANAAYERLVVRPEMVSALFFAIYLFVLTDFKNRDSNRIWILPVIQILWVNMQGIFILGPAVVLFVLIGEWVHPVRKTLFPAFAAERMSPRQLRKTTGLFLGVVAACFVNPYFQKGAVYPFQFFKFFGKKNPYGFSTNILEFISPFKILYHHEAFYWYLVLLAIAVLVLVLKFNLFQTWELLTFFFFLILSFLARRNLLFFALVALPLTAKGLEALLTRRGKQRRDYEKWLAPILLLASLWVTGDHFLRFYEKRHGMQLGFWGIRGDAYPQAAAEFIVKSDLRGNVFNDMGIGGYLIYRLAPERKVFIDGRNIDEGLFSEFLQATRSYGEFKKLANEYDFNYAVIESRAPYLKHLARNLDQDKTWKKVYFDMAIEIFIKNKPPNQSMILSAISHFKLPDRLSFYEKGNIYMQMGFPQFALNAFLQEVKVNPKHSKALNNVASLFERFGKPDEAEKYYSLALESDPDNHLICFNLANFYEKQGKINEAVDLYGKTLTLKPDFAPARQRLEVLQRKD